MVRYIRDTTGRFPKRPYYEQEDLDQECESIISSPHKIRGGMGYQ